MRYSVLRNPGFESLSHRLIIFNIFHWLSSKDLNKVNYILPGEAFNAAGLDIEPFGLSHGKFATAGLKFANVMYFPDFDGRIDIEKLPLKKVETLIMECNDLEKRFTSHNYLSNAIRIAEKIREKSLIKQLVLTHLSDKFPGSKRNCQELISKRVGADKNFEIIAPNDLDKLVV